MGAALYPVEDTDFNLKIKRLIRAQWRVKIRQYTNDPEGDKITSPMAENSKPRLVNVYSFTATKKYINIRGVRGDKGPMYSLYCRNAREGHDKKSSNRDFNDIFNEADNLLSQGEDKVVITKANLPPPISITRSREIFEYDAKSGGDFEIKVQCLYGFRFSGIVGITDKLIVAEIASRDPNNEAWFAVRGYGVSGYINLITDGEAFYATRIVGNKMVIDHDLKHDENRKVVEKMTILDKQRLFEAAATYARHLNDNLA